MTTFSPNNSEGTLKECFEPIRGNIGMYERSIWERIKRGKPLNTNVAVTIGTKRLSMPLSGRVMILKGPRVPEDPKVRLNLEHTEHSPYDSHAVLLVSLLPHLALTTVISLLFYALIKISTRRHKLLK